EDNRLTADGQAIDLVYRRVLISDILSRADDCRALTEAYAARSVCVANTFRCKIPHKKAFFAVLTDERNAALFSDEEREIIAAHVPWTRILADTDTVMHGRRQRLMRLAEDHRESLVLKPNDEYGGTGVTLGWETSPADWYSALSNALNMPSGTWVIQERIPVRREMFPMFDATGTVTMQEMLVDFAPYLFR